ncbi:MAG: DUF1572 family protein, partial [Flavobacteriales bacterium]
LLAEKAMAQVPDDRLFWTFYNDSNSVAIIVQHMSGTMTSRFTNFFDEDGEKSWRNRDGEFESKVTSREEMMHAWESGWTCFFDVLNVLTPDQLDRTVTIRSEEHTVTQAMQRQLAHYSYHTGQIVFLSKMLAMDGWNSLSIPKKKD